MTMKNLLLFISLQILITHFGHAQTDEQLRNPEFLVDQYNQLVVKHNALIERTKVLITENQNIAPNPPVEDPLLKIKLNEALAKAQLLRTN